MSAPLFGVCYYSLKKPPHEPHLRRSLSASCSHSMRTAPVPVPLYSRHHHHRHSYHRTVDTTRNNHQLLEMRQIMCQCSAAVCHKSRKTCRAVCCSFVSIVTIFKRRNHESSRLFTREEHHNHKIQSHHMLA